jgi:hypothetical protein
LLSTEALAAVCQDQWLVQAPPSEYPQTRRWGSWLRTQMPSADGIIWLSRVNLNHVALVLFGDRCPGSVHVINESKIRLDTTKGAIYLNSKLAPYRIEVKPPAERRPRNQTASAEGSPADPPSEVMPPGPAVGEPAVDEGSSEVDV